jgi:hypothetical protein
LGQPMPNGCQGVTVTCSVSGSGPFTVEASTQNSSGTLLGIRGTVQGDQSTVMMTLGTQHSLNMLTYA